MVFNQCNMDIIELIGCNHNELRTKWKRKPKKKKIISYDYEIATVAYFSKRF